MVETFQSVVYVKDDGDKMCENVGGGRVFSVGNYFNWILMTSLAMFN